MKLLRKSGGSHFFDSLRPRHLARPQRVEKPQFKSARLNRGGGARGGSRPPRVGSNAPEALLCKASGERSEDFCAAVRRESNGIFEGCRKSPWTFSTA